MKCEIIMIIMQHFPHLELLYDSIQIHYGIALSYCAVTTLRFCVANVHLLPSLYSYIIQISLIPICACMDGYIQYFIDLNLPSQRQRVGVGGEVEHPVQTLISFQALWMCICAFMLVCVDLSSSAFYAEVTLRKANQPTQYSALTC